MPDRVGPADEQYDQGAIAGDEPKRRHLRRMAEEGERQRRQRDRHMDRDTSRKDGDAAIGPRSWATVTPAGLSTALAPAGEAVPPGCPMARCAPAPESRIGSVPDSRAVGACWGFAIERFMVFGTSLRRPGWLPRPGVPAIPGLAIARRARRVFRLIHRVTVSPYPGHDAARTAVDLLSRA